MRDKYLEFVYRLSKNFHKKFGNIWWYSLLHEKNTSKSDTIHVLLKDLNPPEKRHILSYLLEAVMKYFVFVTRYCLFKLKRTRPNTEVKNLFVSYYADFFDVLYGLEDSEVLIIPQKFDWKSVWRDEGRVAVDQFLSFKDLIVVPLLYINNVFKFLVYGWSLKRQIELFGDVFLERDDAWYIFRDEVLKSFLGSVLVEGLFFEKIYLGIFLQFSNIEKIIYVYEGLQWEKALCLVFKDKKKIGVLCTLPSKNMTQFWYDRNELDIMPVADKLCVIGPRSGGLSMATKRVVELGATRHGYLQSLIGREVKSDRVVVALGYNDKQNEELVEWVYDSDYKNVYVREHPSRKFTQDRFPYDMNPNLECGTLMVSSDSMITFDAVALGIDINIVELDSYANLSPIPAEFYDWRKPMFSPDRLNEYFTFREPKEMIEILEEL